MTKDEALKLALEALEKSHTCPLLPDDCAEAITAIKEVLAQPAVTESHKQEPVTWRYKIVDVFGRPAWTLKTPKSDTRVLESQPLYTTPPQRKPLTDLQIGQILDDPNIAEAHQGHWRVLPFAYARAIEAAHGIKENT